MSRVITFSRTFPRYHPKAGQPTYFVRSIWESLCQMNQLPDMNMPDLDDELKSFYEKVTYTPKHHTIRAGHRWKAGDWFSPRVWSGKPYNSKQIIIAPDIQVKKVWNIYKDEYKWELPGASTIQDLSVNDGLSLVDFIDWFMLSRGKVFDGQIICWNENIEY